MLQRALLSDTEFERAWAALLLSCWDNGGDSLYTESDERNRNLITFIDDDEYLQPRELTGTMRSAILRALRNPDPALRRMALFGVRLHRMHDAGAEVDRLKGDADDTTRRLAGAVEREFTVRLPAFDGLDGAPLCPHEAARENRAALVGTGPRCPIDDVLDAIREPVLSDRSAARLASIVLFREKNDYADALVRWLAEELLDG